MKNAGFTRTSGLVMALVVLWLSPTSRAMACVVGNGTGASCTEAALAGCLSGGGTVTFNCGGAKTITVASTQTISADTTIDGGSLITVSGGNTVGVFSVNAGINFTVQNLTIANGNSATYGGGVFNNGGTLTVANSTFSGNHADFFGGGIWNSNSGTLTVTNSTFSGNSANSGGGIVNNGGTVTVANSTFSGNGTAEAAGIWNSNNGGTLTVTNSTFSGNSASAYGGGIVSSGGTVTVTNSTFSGNSANSGGGIWNQSGTLTVTNVIVANSVSGGNCAGNAVTDGGHNIDDGTTCGFTGTSFSNTNPMLDPGGLADNGGPTQTIATEPGSPAVNAGDEGVCSTTTGPAPVDNFDQRHFVRPGTGATNCSIGAYEANSVPVPASCAPTPLSSCSQTTKGAVKLKGNTITAKQNLQWKWSNGTAMVGDFGNPMGMGTTSYALCVYDDNALVMSPTIAAGGTCGTNKPCWTVNSSGQFTYKNKTGNADGITAVTLKPNAVAGKARIQIKGKGASLALPLPLTDATNVTVQFVKDLADGSKCWQSVFSMPAKKSSSLLFQDQIP